MILSHYELDNTFDLQPNKVNVLVVENQNLFWQYWRELHQQIEGNDGRFVLSANGEDMPLSRHALIVADYVSLSVNNKKILNKLYSTLDYVIHNNCLAEYQKLLEAWSNLYLRINIESPVPIVHDEITTSVLLKACSATIEQQDTPGSAASTAEQGSGGSAAARTQPWWQKQCFISGRNRHWLAAAAAGPSFLAAAP